MKSGGVKKNLINVIIVLMIIGVVFLNSYSYMQKKNGFFLDFILNSSNQLIISILLFKKKLFNKD